jgi:hypothetical protein
VGRLLCFASTSSGAGHLWHVPGGALLPTSPPIGLPASEVRDEVPLSGRVEWHGSATPNHQLLGQPVRHPDVAPNWRMVLQIDSDAAVSLDFGDGAAMSFWMSASDLAAGRFAAARAVRIGHG